MRIAMFRDSFSDMTFIRKEESEKYMGSSDIRVSEYIDVEFPIIQAAVEVANEAHAKRTEAKQIIDTYRKTVAAS